MGAAVPGASLALPSLVCPVPLDTRLPAWSADRPSVLHPKKGFGCECLLPGTPSLGLLKSPRGQDVSFLSVSGLAYVISRPTVGLFWARVIQEALG